MAGDERIGPAFTAADVAALERIAHAHRLNRFADDEDVLKIIRLRDRIAALLPPETT